MIETQYEFLLPVSPRQAFDYISNPGHDAVWQASCQTAERVDGESAAGPEGGLGCRYHIVFSLLGRRMAFVCEVTEHDPGKAYAFQVVEGPFRYQGRYVFSADESGCKVFWHFAADPGKFFGLLPAALLRKVVLSQFEGDVKTLRQRLLTTCTT
jgi:uncharacterized protein